LYAVTPTLSGELTFSSIDFLFTPTANHNRISTTRTHHHLIQK
jgi:hypothetical protein